MGSRSHALLSFDTRASGDDFQKLPASSPQAQPSAEGANNQPLKRGRTRGDGLQVTCFALLSIPGDQGDDFKNLRYWKLWPRRPGSSPASELISLAASLPKRFISLVTLRNISSGAAVGQLTAPFVFALPAVIVTTFSLRSRITVSCTGLPRLAWMVCIHWLVVAITWPFTFVITSPARRPAAAPGLLSSTRFTSRPCPSWMPK